MTPMQAFFSYLTELMTGNAAMFQQIGLNLFRGFAVILIAWFGIKWALAAAGGGAPLPLDRFASLILTIAFGYAMIHYYSNPIPGFGVSFVHLVADQTQAFANTLNQASAQKIMDGLNNAFQNTDQPSATSILTDALGFLKYAIVAILIVLAQAAIYTVIAFGYIAQAIAVLLGPVFIPFFIVPQMDWMFWGWLKSFLQYSFYPVVANAYLYVFGNFLLDFFKVHPPPYDGLHMAFLFLPFCMLLVAFILGIFLIPSLVNSLFSGRSGESHLTSFPGV